MHLVFLSDWLCRRVFLLTKMANTSSRLWKEVQSILHLSPILLACWSSTPEPPFLKLKTFVIPRGQLISLSAYTIGISFHGSSKFVSSFIVIICLPKFCPKDNDLQPSRKAHGTSSQQRAPHIDQFSRYILAGCYVHLCSWNWFEGGCLASSNKLVRKFGKFKASGDSLVPVSIVVKILQNFVVFINSMGVVGHLYLTACFPSLLFVMVVWLVM